MKKIEWRNKALRQLRKIKSAKERTLVADQVSKLAHFPACRNVKAIVNSDNLFRLRVKDWRVIFTEQLEIVTPRRDEKKR